MIGPWAQFLRNFFCVIKALFTSSQLFFNKKVFSQNYVNGYVSAKTTWIEMFTAPFQFVAVILNLRGGVQSIVSGLSNYPKFSKYLRYLDRHTLTQETKPSSTILRHRILREIYLAKLGVFVGVMGFVIAIGFVFLTLNSLHITGANHPHPVYAGLVGQEICLVYFLFEMLTACYRSLAAKDEYQFLALLLQNLNGGEMTQAQLLTLLYDFGYHDNRLYAALTLIDPSFSSWRDDKSDLHTGGSMDGIVSQELDSIDSYLKSLTASTDAAKNRRNDLINALQVRGQKLSNEFTLNVIYFILNFVAGYGYMMGILTFYFPHTAATVPLWLRIIYLGLTPAQADWWGNFSGDLSWTIEPAIVLTLAYYHQFVATPQTVSGSSTEKVTKSQKSTSVPKSAFKSPITSTSVSLRKSPRKKKVQ